MVVDVEEHVRPFRISKVSFKAESVLELPVHTVFRTETRVGDQLEISRGSRPRASGLGLNLQPRRFPHHNDGPKRPTCFCPIEMPSACPCSPSLRKP